MKRAIRRLSIMLFVIAAAIAANATAEASLMIAGETVVVAPGGTGFVDFTLTNNFSVPQSLSAFSMQLVLGGTGITFTGVDDQTASPYIFGSEGTGILSFDTFPNTDFTASDVSLSPSGFVTLSAGEKVGLSRIGFAVSPFAPAGLYPITFGVGVLTQFLDDSGNVISATDLSFQDGLIDVQGTPTAVPEPASALLFGMGFCWVILAGRKRRVSKCAVNFTTREGECSPTSAL